MEAKDTGAGGGGSLTVNIYEDELKGSDVAEVDELLLLSKEAEM